MSSHTRSRLLSTIAVARRRMDDLVAGRAEEVEARDAREGRSTRSMYMLLSLAFLAPDLGKALEGRDPKRELVLLAHQPRAAFEADKHGVGLQLSGHTHGGQIWPWNYLVYLQQPIVAGLAKIGRTLVYVSRGTGYWGPPMRLHAPAEITRIVLESGT